jgi:hypothetical protein
MDSLEGCRFFGIDHCYGFYMGNRQDD